MTNETTGLFTIDVAFWYNTLCIREACMEDGLVSTATSKSVFVCEKVKNGIDDDDDETSTWPFLVC